ncbi:uncharacterized protein LOC130736159 [Lotus japonicus]|uniref:uncharacterized protein LOC130736159 n=1 Tax=Lotus japonicus TaxID=34305 RepID=UPI00258C74A7|nr:uncharacterized protein LOC130736159 [Lotus japonicus]
MKGESPPPTTSVRKERATAALPKKEEACKRRDEATRKRRACSATTAVTAVQEPEPELEQGSGQGEEDSSGEEEDEGSTEEEEEEEEDEEDGGHTQADQGEEDDDDDIFFLGGPYDNTLLKSFKQHMSLEVWKHYKKPAEVLDRGVLKTYHHGNAMLGNDKKKHKDVLKCFSTYVKRRVVAAGLLPLLTCNLLSVDKTMLAAFVERWKYSEKDPRACKWVTKRGTVDLHAKRLILDDLRDNNVIWTPYDEHRVD